MGFFDLALQDLPLLHLGLKCCLASAMREPTKRAAAVPDLSLILQGQISTVQRIALRS